VKAKWRGHELGLTLAFVADLVLGGGVEPEQLNTNKPGDMSRFDTDSLRLVVEEGRRQLQVQADTFRHTTDRGQVLLTMSLVVLGFVAATFGSINAVAGLPGIVGLGIWSFSVGSSAMGIAAAASVVVSKAQFRAPDTTQLSGFEPPILRQLAGDYAETVILGETTVAARVTMLRQATRLVCWGAVLAATAFMIAAAA
jgi:hypothetical protein